MNPLDNVKRHIVDSVAARTMDRIGVRNETRAYTSQELFDMLTHVATAAIELWNGQIQAELEILQVDFENRVKFRNLNRDPFIIVRKD